MSGCEGRIVDSILRVDRAAWDACFAEEAECHAYYAACDAAAAASGIGLRVAAVCIRDAGAIIAVAPFFRLDYRLDTPLQGRLKQLGGAVGRWLPGLVTLKAFCIGSPYAERCHIGFVPRLGAAERALAFTAIAATMQEHAVSEGVPLVAWKDLAPADEDEFGAALEKAGFARLGSLPVAVLDLPFQDEAAYLASLSAATRKDIRRKLARAGAVRIEFRSDIAGLEQAIADLYERTRARSGLDYGDLEILPPGYFAAVSRALGERAVFALYWVGPELAAFNMLLVERGRVIDKFLGMRYPLAREHNIYAVSWMANIRFCLERRIGLLQSGQTAYAAKLRFGSRLVPSVLHVRHRFRLFQWVLRLFSPWLGFERFDPDLAMRAGKPAA